MTARFFGVVLATVGLLGVSVAAHHGAASFDTTKEYTLKGKVTEWIWANPHCFLKFDAKDDTGEVRNWAVEVSNPTDMTRLGWARTSFKFGDEVTVTLQPVKNGAPVGRLRRVVLPNGETLGTGEASALRLRHRLQHSSVWLPPSLRFGETRRSLGGGGQLDGAVGLKADATPRISTCRSA